MFKLMKDHEKPGCFISSETSQLASVLPARPTTNRILLNAQPGMLQPFAYSLGESHKGIGGVTIVIHLKSISLVFSGILGTSSKIR